LEICTWIYGWTGRKGEKEEKGGRRRKRRESSTINFRKSPEIERNAERYITSLSIRICQELPVFFLARGSCVARR
jgi:hypothetical protein